MKSAAQESIDRLFAEPFEPLWMKWQREAAMQIEEEKRTLLLKHYTQRSGRYIDPIQVKSDEAWRIAAYRSYLRIASRCVGNVYMNA